MALRNILTGEDDFLHRRCREITEFGERTVVLAGDLTDTLREVNGLGLAAPQVGVLRRVVVVACDEQLQDIIELINPEIIDKQGEVGLDEACLSCPGMIGYVLRPEKVTVRAYDRFGTGFEREFEGLFARAVCHEIDHLEGILFTDIAERVYDDADEYRAAMDAAKQAEDRPEGKIDEESERQD